MEQPIVGQSTPDPVVTPPDDSGKHSFFSKKSNIIGMLAILITIAAIPLTVKLSQQRQELRNRASTSEKGYLDRADGIEIAGWACDPNDPNAKTSVYLYDGPKENNKLIKGIIANQPAQPGDDATKIKAECGNGNSDHRFVVCTDPANSSCVQINDGNPHQIYAYVAGGSVQLANSPKTLSGTGGQVSGACVEKGNSKGQVAFSQMLGEPVLTNQNPVPAGMKKITSGESSLQHGDFGIAGWQFDSEAATSQHGAYTRMLWRSGSDVNWDDYEKLKAKMPNRTFNELATVSVNWDQSNCRTANNGKCPWDIQAGEWSQLGRDAIELLAGEYDFNNLDRTLSIIPAIQVSRPRHYVFGARQYGQPDVFGGHYDPHDAGYEPCPDKNPAGNPQPTPVNPGGSNPGGNTGGTGTNPSACFALGNSRGQSGPGMTLTTPPLLTKTGGNGTQQIKNGDSSLTFGDTGVAGWKWENDQWGGRVLWHHGNGVEPYYDDFDQIKDRTPNSGRRWDNADNTSNAANYSNIHDWNDQEKSAIEWLAGSYDFNHLDRKLSLISEIRDSQPRHYVFGAHQYGQPIPFWATSGFDPRPAGYENPACGTGTNPSGTPNANATVLNFTVALHGIGSVGDSYNGDPATSTKDPKTPVRPATIVITDAQNSDASRKEKVTTITYNKATGKYDGSVDISDLNLPTGNYSVKIKTYSFLRKSFCVGSTAQTANYGVRHTQCSGTVAITAGTSNKLPDQQLIAGDTNSNNELQVDDYNAIRGCVTSSVENRTPQGCTDATKKTADLNDDGLVNVTDYILFVRELAFRFGE